MDWQVLILCFLINGAFISGAQPFEVFQQVIEEQLKTLAQ
jgi:predicted DsbA family dithiol-disulfide isomerase